MTCSHNRCSTSEDATLKKPRKVLLEWAREPVKAEWTLAINISTPQFAQADFVDQVKAVLERTGARPDRLKLELTESMLVSNMDDIIAKMGALKCLGVRFSLDDFGTGYSSLSYLKRLPLDQLKIDQSFVREMSTVFQFSPPVVVQISPPG